MDLKKVGGRKDLWLDIKTGAAKARCESKAEEEEKGGVVAHHNVDLSVEI